MKDVASKLESAIQGANLSVHIAELRQSAFDAEVLRLEELKKAERDKPKKKESKEEPKDDQESKFTETPEPDSSKKLWD
jgi:hypothetical protein